MRQGGLIGLILLATFAGCGSGNGGRPDSAVTPGDAWAEIGTGTTGFEELADESDLPLIAGPQGGHHFIVHARIHGLQPGDPAEPGTTQNPRTLFTVWTESGDRLDVAPPPYQLGYEEVSDGVYSLASGRIIQVREEEVVAMYGTRVRIRVEVTDAAGTTVADERWVTAVEEGPVDGDAGPEPDGQVAAWVEIGTGDAGFEAIAEEGDLPLYAGPQGGNHFFLHARMMGLSPDGATTRFSVFDEGGGKINLGGNFAIDYEDAGGGVFVLPNGLVVQMDPVEVPGIGDRVRVQVDLTDTDGIQVTDERWVNVVAP